MNKTLEKQKARFIRINIAKGKWLEAQIEETEAVLTSLRAQLSVILSLLAEDGVEITKEKEI